MSPSDSLINPERFDELVKTREIFGSVTRSIDYPLLKALEKMIRSEYPCALLSLENNHRLWFNHKIIEQGLEVDAVEGVGRDLTDYWLPGDLEEMIKNIISCDSRTGLDWSFQAAIIPPKWGKFRSHIERVESSLGVCQLHFIQEFKEIPHPLIRPS